MKRLYYLILSFILLLGVQTSCSSDSPIPGINEEGGEELIFSPKNIRYSNRPNTVAEDNFTTLRVLAFNRATGECKYNYYYAYNIAETFRIRLKKGIYDLVFIANEISDLDAPGDDNASKKLQDIGNAGTEDTRYMKALDDIWFDRSAFDSLKFIPMAVVKENIEVLGPAHWVDKVENKTYNDGGVTPMPIELVRLGVRVDVVLQTKKEKIKERVKGINFLNIPNKVPLLPTYRTPGLDYGTSIYNAETTATDANHTLSIKEAMGDSLGWYHYTFPNDATKEDYYEWSRTYTILPSSVFSDPTNAEKAISLNLIVNKENGDEGGESDIVRLGINTPNTTLVENGPLPPQNNYTLPRNTRLTLEGNVSDYNLFISISVRDWTEVKTEVPPIQVPY